MVGQHGVPGGAGDAFGELVRAQDKSAQKLALLRALKGVAETAAISTTMIVSETLNLNASPRGIQRRVTY